MFQIILFQFGMGENANYVILELYAQGNILLTDSNFTVLTLLRSHRLVICVLLCNLNLLSICSIIEMKICMLVVIWIYFYWLSCNDILIFLQRLCRM